MKTFGEMLDTSEPSEEPIEEVTAQPEPEAKAEEPDARPRNPDGTFAKKGEEESAPPAPVEKQEFDGAATLAERRKRQELEAELQRLKESLKQPPEPAPDMFEEPERWQLEQQNFAARQALNVKLDISEDAAREKHGDELVDQARDWAIGRFPSDPGFYHRVMSDRNPYRFVVQEFQREQFASQVDPDDFAAFQQWKQQKANPPAPQQLPPTLTGERNLGTRSEPPQLGPATFAEALGR